MSTGLHCHALVSATLTLNIVKLFINELNQRDFLPTLEINIAEDVTRSRKQIYWTKSTNKYFLTFCRKTLDQILIQNRNFSSTFPKTASCVWPLKVSSMQPPLGSCSQGNKQRNVSCFYKIYSLMNVFPFLSF